MALFAHYCKG